MMNIAQFIHKDDNVKFNMYFVAYKVGSTLSATPAPTPTT